MHPVIKELQEECPEVQTLWYLDDGILVGEPTAVAAALDKLASKLAAIDLRLNTAKCEFLCNENMGMTILDSTLKRTPCASWSYLGAPLLDGPCECLTSSLSKTRTVGKRIRALAKDFPQCALKLLQQTLGACRVEHICQAVPPDILQDALLVHCSKELQECAKAVLGMTSITDSQWRQMTLPSAMGGLGIRDPTWTAASSHLANMCVIKDNVARLGIPELILDGQLRRALDLYHDVLHTRPSVLPEIVPKLQRVLTAAIYKRNIADLLDNATNAANDYTRISSLTSPHAMAWLDGPGILSTIESHEFRCALRFVMGVPLRNESYSREECGLMADNYGLHAVSCLRTGEIGRGHTCLKYALDHLLSLSGCNTIVEHPLPDDSAANQKAMDIVITSGLGTAQIAVDVTIVNPLRPSTLPTEEINPTLDNAAVIKTRKYSQLCSKQSWKFTPLVFDVFGASHPTCRAFLKKVIKQLETKYPNEQRPGTGRLVAQADNPAGLALGALSWKKRPKEPQQLQHQLQQAPTPTSETLNTGIYYNPQPSSLPLTEYVSSLVAPTNSSQSCHRPRA